MLLQMCCRGWGGQDAIPVPEGTAVLATATRLQIGPAELSFNSAASTLPSAYYRAEHSVYEGGMYQGCGRTAAAVEHDRITFSHLPPGSHISQCESPHASRFPQAQGNQPHRAVFPWSTCFSQIPTHLINFAASPSEQLVRVFITWN